MINLLSNGPSSSQYVVDGRILHGLLEEGGVVLPRYQKPLLFEDSFSYGET